MNPLDQVVTVSEMAEALGVSAQHIRKQCKDGKLKCRKSSDGVWLILAQSKEENKMNTTYTNGTDDVKLLYFNNIYSVSIAILGSTNPKKGESVFHSREVAHDFLVKNGYEIKA